MKKRPLKKTAKLCLSFIFVLLFIPGRIFSQNNLCSTAFPFCIGSTYSYPAGVNAGVGESGPIYGCLGSEPNPAWYYLKIANSGNLEIKMVGGNSTNDIDFCCWGPFTPSPACDSLTGGTSLASHHGIGPGGGYPSGNIVDCSYDASTQEWCYIPNAVTGQYYMLMITNYSNTACNIFFTQDIGPGTTDCSMIASTISNNSPLCPGQTLNLTVSTPTTGATYSWTGPGGFTSTTMSPTIPNVTIANSGIYTMTMTVNGQAAPPVQTMVTIYPPPVITLLNGDSLVSNAAYGNQWYYHDTLGNIQLAGDTMHYYNALTTGYYFTVVADFNGCISDTSNMIYVQITGINEYGPKGFNMYPNPAQNNMIIENATPIKEATLSIYNIQGQLLSRQKIIQTKTSLDISNFANGLYFVTLQTEKEITTKKLVKK